MTNLGGEYGYAGKRDSIVSQTADIDSFDSSYESQNPFKNDEKNGYEELEYALQVLEDLTARMNVSK